MPRKFNYTVFIRKHKKSAVLNVQGVFKGYRK